jgi:hypothetical protein
MIATTWANCKRSFPNHRDPLKHEVERPWGYEIDLGDSPQDNKLCQFFVTIPQGDLWFENAQLLIGFIASNNGAGIIPGSTFLVTIDIITAATIERISEMA